MAAEIGIGIKMCSTCKVLSFKAQHKRTVTEQCFLHGSREVNVPVAHIKVPGIAGTHKHSSQFKLPSPIHSDGIEKLGKEDGLIVERSYAYAGCFTGIRGIYR